MPRNASSNFTDVHPIHCVADRYIPVGQCLSRHLHPVQQAQGCCVFGVLQPTKVNRSAIWQVRAVLASSGFLPVVWLLLLSWCLTPYFSVLYYATPKPFSIHRQSGAKYSHRRMAVELPERHSIKSVTVNFRLIRLKIYVQWIILVLSIFYNAFAPAEYGIKSVSGCIPFENIRNTVSFYVPQCYSYKLLGILNPR